MPVCSVEQMNYLMLNFCWIVCSWGSALGSIGLLGTNFTSKIAEPGHYPLTIRFTEDYPSQPPLCSFPSGFFHINVYDTGRVCLSIINNDDSGTWKPSISVKQVGASNTFYLLVRHYNKGRLLESLLLICRRFRHMHSNLALARAIIGLVKLLLYNHLQERTATNPSASTQRHIV